MTQIVILKVAVPAGREREFENVVADRSKVHRSKPGFERMYVLRPAGNGSEYRLVVWWKDLPSAEAWVRTETYALSEDKAHPGLVVGSVPHEVLHVVKEY